MAVNWNGCGKKVVVVRFKILWRIFPLIGKDLETNNETLTVAMQRHDKHASTTIKALLEAEAATVGLQKRNWGVLYVVRAEELF
jgi:hypothetical protein